MTVWIPNVRLAQVQNFWLWKEVKTLAPFKGRGCGGEEDIFHGNLKIKYFALGLFWFHFEIKP